MTDPMLERLQREHAGRRDTWTVYPLTGPTTWHTRPAGSPSCVHQETTGEHMEAWLCQVTALQDKGASLQFGRDGQTITATITWTDPATGTPAAHGPAPVPEAIAHAETALTTRAAP